MSTPRNAPPLRSSAQLRRDPTASEHTFRFDTTAAGRVLLCDDEEMFVDALAGALRHKGHDVVDVTTDPGAVAELTSRHRPDVCIIDLNFDGHVRADLPQAIRQSDPGTAVMLLTGVGHPAAWHAYDADLVNGLVGKSSCLDVLDKALRDVMAGHRVAVGVNRLPATSSVPDHLTERERQVLTLLATGASTKEIGQELHIGLATARSHVQHLLQKLGVHTRVEVVRHALAEGIVGVP